MLKIGTQTLMMNNMDEITKMATRPGFTEVFWQRLRANRRAGGADSRKQIYDAMDVQYEEKYGRPCFPSYDAFKKYLNRHQ